MSLKACCILGLFQVVAGQAPSALTVGESELPSMIPSGPPSSIPSLIPSYIPSGLPSVMGLSEDGATGPASSGMVQGMSYCLAAAVMTSLALC
jgi:hypothetical protein